MISIIVPTVNNSKFLSIALNSVLTQSYDEAGYEVIVVDNGSTDDTKEIILKAQESYQNKNIQFIYDSVPGQLTGRHRGANEAKGDILVFIDDDIIADKNWLAVIAETFKDTSIMLVGGKSLPNYEIDPPYWLEWFWVHLPYGKFLASLSLLDFGDEVREIDPNYVWGLNFSIRKSALFDLGGFHPDVIPKEYQHFQGDGESGLTIKAKERCYKAIYQPKALVYHQVPKSRMTFEYFDKRYYYQGVCDDFIYIRRKYGKYAPINNPKKTIRSRIPEPIKKPLRFIKNIFFKFLHRHVLLQSIEERKLKARFNKAYQQGYDFHRKAVADNPNLLEWVLKDNYWDYRLPELDFKGRISKYDES